MEIRAMYGIKNGDLVVRGIRVDALDLEAFTSVAEMIDWECGEGGFVRNRYISEVLSPFEEYEAVHGEGACVRDGAETVEGLFGFDFARSFRARKDALGREFLIGQLEGERCALVDRLWEVERDLASLRSGRGRFEPLRGFVR